VSLLALRMTAARFVALKSFAWGKNKINQDGSQGHALLLPSGLQEEFRRECMQSVLFAIPDKIEIAKDRRFVMFFHDCPADAVNMVHFRVPTCSNG